MTRLIKLISEHVGLSSQDILKIISSAPRRYKEFEIPKRNGRGMRKIAQPSREVKSIQRFLCDNVLNSLPVHDCAHGYVGGRGIRTNATAHQDSNFILKMDFEDFFPSIRPVDLRKHLKIHTPDRFDDTELRQLELLLFWMKKGDDKLRMCIGAPSSPAISNTILFSMDTRMADACLQFGAIYTRYADDLTFSSKEPNVLRVLQSRIRQIVEHAEYPSLSINEKKTIHVSRGQRRTVTGVNITPCGSLSIGRKRARLMRSMAHRHSLGLLGEDDQRILGGLISFASDIDPGLAARIRVALLTSPPLVA